MAEKVFRRFDDLDPAAEAVIGGVHRHQTLLVPPDLAGRERLLVPGDDAMTARWNEAFARVGSPGPGDAFRTRTPDSGPQTSLVLEVGSGRGRFLAALAAARPDALFLGFETRLSNCARTLDRGDKHACKNLWMAWGDARYNVPHLVPAGTADEAYLLFPDPWWKKKHARRRHGGAMATALAHALRPGGLLVLKSDVPEYLEKMVESFEATGFYDPGPAPADLPMTDREVRLVSGGIKVFTAAFSRR